MDGRLIRVPLRSPTAGALDGEPLFAVNAALDRIGEGVVSEVGSIGSIRNEALAGQR